MQTDFCNNFNVMQDVARTPWNVTWTITAVEGFTNVVDVVMRHTFGSFTPLIDTRLCGASGGWVPLVSPQSFRLCISSDTLNPCTDVTYRNGYAYGTFTTDQMSLTWYHPRECLAYCWSEVTEGKLELFKQ